MALGCNDGGVGVKPCYHWVEMMCAIYDRGRSFNDPFLQSRIAEMAGFCGDMASV